MTRSVVEIPFRANRADDTARPAIPGVKHVIAIASGKGGVGKSTTATNLALALAAEGARVGMLDADLYGPSQPRMLGLTGSPETRNGQMQPLVGYDIQTMSIGFLMDEGTPVIWRGPMVTRALQQLVYSTAWDDLDYLLIDLPPGTGDIHLTMAQKIPVTGAVIVTTPQDIALLDARKGQAMFEKVGIPVLGIIENMSTHICSECGHEEHVFGQGGAARMARETRVGLLGELPLDIRIRQGADMGTPAMILEPEGPIPRAYGAIAKTLVSRLAVAPGCDSATAREAMPHVIMD